MFCINNLSGDESISFYTGFPNLQTFQATLVYLNPVFTISAVSRETVSSASDVMSLLTVNNSSVNDSSSGCLENEDLRPKTQKRRPLENEDLKNEDPGLGNEDLENEYH